MKPMPDITRSVRLAFRTLALQGSLIAIGIPAACLTALVMTGVLLYPVAGSAAWQPALEFAGGLASAAMAPTASWLFALPAILLALAAGAAFGHWCHRQAAPGESGDSLKRLLTSAWRLLKKSLSPFIPASHLPPAAAGRALPSHPLERTSTSTSAGLSGACPLLE